MAIVDVLSFDLVFGFVLGTMFGFSVNFTLRAIIQTANAGTGRGRSRMFRVAAILLRGFATFAPVPVLYMVYTSMDFKNIGSYVCYDLERYVSWAVCAGIMAICNGVWTTYKQNVITTADTLGIVSRDFDNKYEMLCDASPRQSLSMGSSTMASRVMRSCNRQGEFYCMMSDGLHTTVPCNWEVYKHNVLTLVVPTSVPQYYMQNCIQLPRHANCYWIFCT